MKLRECSDDAANRGMGRAIGDPVPKGLPRSYTNEWGLAWADLWQAITELPLSAVEKDHIYTREQWTLAVQSAFSDTLAAFAAMSNEELDASLALMRDVKPWAFWVATCECMLREHEKRYVTSVSRMEEP